MLWSHPKEIMSQINICCTRGIEALSNTVGQLQLSSTWTHVFSNSPLLTQAHSEQPAPWHYRGHSLAWMHWSDCNQARKCLEDHLELFTAVGSSGHCVALEPVSIFWATFPCSLSLMLVWTSRPGSVQREFQPGRRDEPGPQYPQCWGLHWVLSVQLQAELWGEAWGKTLWNSQRAQRCVVPARCLARDTKGAKGSRHDSAWTVLVRV